jgi:hypothetical protein
MDYKLRFLEGPNKWPDIRQLGVVRVIVNKEHYWSHSFFLNKTKHNTAR